MLTNLGPAQLTLEHAGQRYGRPVLVVAHSGRARGPHEIDDLVLIRATPAELVELGAAGFDFRLGYHLKRRGAAGYP